MPTYEYKCLKCKKTFDHFQKMTESPIKRCIHCGGKVERLIGSGGGFIFKGSGFYINDYKKPAKKEDSKQAPSPSPDKKTSGNKKEK